ncbi:Do family serine endopeptidase [Candidatus Zixiibacteriota bacterium]
MRGVISAVIAAVFTWSAWLPAAADVSGTYLPVTAEGHSPFVGVVQQIKDAVVNISAEINRQNQEQVNPFGSLFDDLFPWQGPQRRRSLGSGFLISGAGLILTNNHVIEDAERITVRLSDKSEFTAELVGTDEATDLALLRIEADHDLPYLEFGDSDSLLVGDWVIAIGNPFPQQGLDRTVTVGVISALGRANLNFAEGRPDYQNYIQTDASINPGNSGGPLVNLRGQVVGINSAIASNTGSSVGIGFAIPVNFAKLVIPDLKSSGKVNRGGLGIQLRDLTWDDVEAEDLPSADGAMVNSVIDGTPAAEAGLRPGDVIVAFDGEPVKDSQHFMRLIWMARADTDVTLSLIRQGEQQEIPVRLGDRETVLATANDTPTPSAAEQTEQWLGLSVETSTPQIAERLNTTYRPGVLVVDVDQDGPAYDKGIRAGMVIGEIDHQVIEDLEDYNRVIGALADRKRAVSLLVYDRRGNTGYIAVRPEYHP